MSNQTSDFSSPSKNKLEPNQHVNFTLGMVLGEDDFNQEFTYLSGRDQWLARDLLGYGTVCGLQVTSGIDETKGPYIQVEPGVALSPRGQLIKVAPAQCAYLDTWISSDAIQNELDIRTKKLPDPKTATLYLTLCYRECYTDDRPVPGEPCRTEAEGDLVKPARIQDDFSLELSWDAPDQQEEEALRSFVGWLRQVKLTEEVDWSPPDPEIHLKEFADLVRASIQPSSPLQSPPVIQVGSPPEDFKIPGSQACEYLRLAFRIWTTELRPSYRGANASCVTPTTNDCVLLAIANIPVSQTGTGAWAINDAIITDPSLLVDVTDRPYLLHLRMLQEWMTCGRAALLTPSDHVTDEVAFDQASDPGSGEVYSRGDHTHGTPPRPFLEDDVVSTPDEETVAGLHTTVARLQGTTLSASDPEDLADGNVLTLTNVEGDLEWRPAPIPDLDGEVTGPLADNRVAKIQTLPVKDTPPSDPQPEQVLMLKGVEEGDGLEWQASDLPPQVTTLPMDGDVGGSTDENHIDKLQGKPVSADDPTPGYVLTYKDEEDGVAAHWEPAELPQVTTLPMDGDVGGTTDQNQIDKLQGKPVFAPNPNPEQVLKFIRARRGIPARWEAADLPTVTLPNLDGDVINAPTDNFIRNLQRKLVDAKDPGIGQVLTFVGPDEENGLPERWVPADPQAGDGAFVTRPPEAGRFGIVAAGWLEFNFIDQPPWAVVDPVYNQTYVIDNGVFIYDEHGLGVIIVNFQGYSPERKYILKLTPWVIDGKPFSAFVLDLNQDDKYNLYTFNDKGILIGIGCFLGEEINTKVGRLMIEISQFEPDPEK